MENPETDPMSSSLSSPNFIPTDILIDIIMRLPSKSLVRFGAVSKFWYFFIRNPNFIITHLNRSSLSSNACLLLMPAKFKFNGDKFSVLYETTLIEHSNFEIPWNSNHRLFSKFGNEICFCNGVICFSSYYRAAHQLRLFNPSLRRLKILPPSCIVAVWNRFNSVFGFGVDNVSGDYKVVRIFYDSWNWEARRPMVEVYSLRSDSWKRVELNFNVPHVHYLNFSSVLCNGAIHWFADADSDKPRVILNFNLCDEMFHEMQLPVGLPIMKRGYVFLFKESLSMFIETFDEYPDEDLRYEVWIMKEYGVVESWTKEFIGLVKGGESEVGFSKSGKVVLRKNDGMLAVLDLECGQLKDIGFHEKLYRVSNYVESLVLLEDGVTAQAQLEMLTHQAGGGPSSSSSSVVEDDDANWRAAIDSAVSAPTNEFQTQTWRDWGTS